jgi:hypothetical protein
VVVQEFLDYEWDEDGSLIIGHGDEYLRILRRRAPCSWANRA